MGALSIKRGTKMQLAKEAAAGDFTPMKNACKKLVLEGVTTVEEALKAINSTAE